MEGIVRNRLAGAGLLLCWLAGCERVASTAPSLDASMDSSPEDASIPEVGDTAETGAVQPRRARWLACFDSEGHPSPEGISVVDDGIYVAGALRAPIRFDKELVPVAWNTFGSGSDAYLARLSLHGEPVWSVRIGGQSISKHVTVDGIASGPDGAIAVLGNFYGHAVLSSTDGNEAVLTAPSDIYPETFLAQFDALGRLLWHEILGVSAIVPAAQTMTADGEGNLYVASGGVGSLDDFALAAFDPSGAPRFHRTAQAYLEPTSMLIGPEGNLTIVGNALHSVPVPTDDGGTSVPLAPGASTICAESLDANGAFRWAACPNGDPQNVGFLKHNLAGLPSGGDLVVAGPFTGTIDFGSNVSPMPDAGIGTGLVSSGLTDFFMTRLDPFGHVVWARSFGSKVENAALLGMAVYADGSVLIGGWARGDPFEPGDVPDAAQGGAAYLAKFDSKGGLQWHEPLGPPAFGVARNGLAAIEDRGVFLAMAYEGSLGPPFWNEAECNGLIVAELEP